MTPTQRRRRPAKARRRLTERDRRDRDHALQIARVAVHEAGHAVVGLRLGLSIDSAIIGPGLTNDEGRAIGGLVGFGRSWNADDTAEGRRRRVVVRLAGAAADIVWATDTGFDLDIQKQWDSNDAAWVIDRNQAVGDAIEATGTTDLQVINECVNDCLNEAIAVVEESRSAIAAAANHLIENCGHAVAGELLRVLIAAALAQAPKTSD